MNSFGLVPHNNGDKEKNIYGGMAKNKDRKPINIISGGITDGNGCLVPPMLFHYHIPQLQEYSGECKTGLQHQLPHLYIGKSQIQVCDFQIRAKNTDQK